MPRNPFDGSVTAVEARKCIKKLSAALYRATRIHAKGSAIRVECEAALAEASDVRKKLRTRRCFNQGDVCHG